MIVEIFVFSICFENFSVFLHQALFFCLIIFCTMHKNEKSEIKYVKSFKLFARGIFWIRLSFSLFDSLFSARSFFSPGWKLYDLHFQPPFAREFCERLISIDLLLLSRNCRVHQIPMKPISNIMYQLNELNSLLIGCYKVKDTQANCFMSESRKAEWYNLCIKTTIFVARMNENTFVENEGSTSTINNRLISFSRNSGASQFIWMDLFGGPKSDFSILYL